MPFRRSDSPIWYTRVDGRRVSLRTADKAEALRRERDARGIAWRRSADPDYRPTHETALSKALNRYVAELRRKGRSPHTVDRNEEFAQHATRILGRDTRLRALDAAAFDRYVERREVEGASQPTIHKELCALRGCMRLAKRRGEWRGDLDWIPRVAGGSKPGTRALSHADVLRLFAALPARRRAFCAFIVATGADLSSAFAARRGDVDAERWRVLVRGTKTASRRRVVPVPAPFRRFLEDAIAYLPFESWGNVRRDLEAACKRAGVDRVTPRDLRRSCTTILRNEHGVEDLGALAALLGHRDTRMVERVYGPLNLDGLEARLPR